jgi:protein gp37
MNKTKIEWCDATINPVVGCPRGCVYCYARKMNDRFKWVEDFSKPQFFPERLKQLESKKPKSIFMDSMSDIAFWSNDVIAKALRAMNNNPQHKYIMLTKSRKGQSKVFSYYIDKMYTELKDVDFYMGVTITRQNDFSNAIAVLTNFLSIEPILEPIDIELFAAKADYLKQIIIGAETGNRRGKIIPKKEWIDDIVKQADEYGIRVFMKNSLKSIMGDDFRQDKLIWEVQK